MVVCILNSVLPLERRSRDGRLQEVVQPASLAYIAADNRRPHLKAGGLELQGPRLPSDLHAHTQLIHECVHMLTKTKQNSAMSLEVTLALNNGFMLLINASIKGLRNGIVPYRETQPHENHDVLTMQSVQAGSLITEKWTGAHNISSLI